MRGTDHQQSSMFSYISAEQRVMADAALAQLGPAFDAIYARSGRSSIKAAALGMVENAGVKTGATFAATEHSVLRVHVTSKTHPTGNSDMDTVDMLCLDGSGFRSRHRNKEVRPVEWGYGIPRRSRETAE